MDTSGINHVTPRSWNRSDSRKRLLISAGCLLLLLAIGALDYFVGYQVTVIVLYLLPIGLAAWYVDSLLASVLGLVSVFFWLIGDMLAGAPSPGWIIQVWNGGIVLMIFLIVVYLIHRLKHVLLDLESQVRDRTKELVLEMAERKKLEHEIVDLAERERQHLGHELHDVVCQEIASISIALRLLEKRLEVMASPEVAQVREIAALIDHSLQSTRQVARGFFTTGFDGDNLVEALHDLVAKVEKRHPLKCELTWSQDLMIKNEDVAIHLFRIAQEGIHNAIKHAQSTHIQVKLARRDEFLDLEVVDDGIGLRNNPQQGKKGLGLRIMAYRASLLNGKFEISGNKDKGVRLLCRVPVETVEKNLR